MTSSFSRLSRPVLVRNSLALGFVLVGFTLSMVSALGLCSSQCAETQAYRIGGLPFSWFGLSFFAALAIILAVSRKTTVLDFVPEYLVLTAIGAEGHFIFLQKYEIGKWCPICLGIAACVFSAGCVLLPTYLRGEPGGRVMNHGKSLAIKRTVAVFLLLAGLGISFGLVAKEGDVFAAEVVKNQVLGNPSSQIELYVVTDWFCPMCRMVEPAVNKGVSVNLSRAKIMFIDLPVHPQSLNYVPYNLSLLVNAKPRYLSARQYMYELASRKESPTQEEVSEAIKPSGATLKMLNFSEITVGMQYNQKLVESLKINATPTIVAYNRKENRIKTLSGIQEISAENITVALDEISNRRKK